MKLIFLLSAILIVYYSSAQIEIGRLVHYKLDGDAIDQSPNTLNGIINGAVPGTDRFSTINSALTFDGIDDYVSLPLSNILKPQLPLTIAFWVKLDETRASNFYCSDYIDFYYYGFWVGLTLNNEVHINFGNGGNAGASSRTSKVSSTTLTIGEWHHVVCIIRAQNDMEIYIDCVNAGGTYSGGGGSQMIYSINYSPRLFNAVALNGIPTSFFKGQMDDLMVWNRELTANEITSFCQIPCPITISASLVLPSCGNSDGSITLNPQPADNYTYSWNPNVSATNQATNLSSGTYNISVSNSSCTIDTSIILAGNTTFQTSIITSPNTVCDGYSQSCDYTGPSILINEINISPSQFNGNIYGQFGTPAGGEWIELFNPNWCDSIDISGYSLGSYNSNGSGVAASFGMGYVLPPNTVVPPLGFVLVRGVNAPAPPAGTIDIVVDTVGNRICVEGGLNVSRFWFQDAGSWFAFYDRQGVPQDAISWGNPITSDLDFRPCIPPNNQLPASVTFLPAYNETGIGSLLGPSFVGMTYVRIPDGGEWSTTLADENTSIGTCNVLGGCNVNTGVTSTCNGSAQIVVTSGQAPFQFSWNDDLNQKTDFADSLCAGNYNVLITDANNCTGTVSVEILNDFFDIQLSSNNPSCSNNDGQITVNVSPTDNYSYVWSSNANVSDTVTTILTNLAGDSYSLTVSTEDCTIDTTVTLASPIPITDVNLAITNEVCTSANGSIEVLSVVGGTPGYQYNFDGQGFSSNTVFNNLTAGSYNLLIQDTNACVYNESLIIVTNSPGPTDLDYTVIDATCGDPNGVITIDNVTGGTSPFQFSINNQAFSSSTAYSNLNIGNYNLAVQDANGCLFTINPIVISNIPGPTDLDLNSVASICALNNGQVNIISVVGGTSPYSYNFNQQGFSSLTSFIDLSPNQYPVQVQDANNCIYEELITVVVDNSNAPYSFATVVSNPNCGQDNGSIEVTTILGGTPNFNYQLNSFASSPNPIFENLDLGTFSIQIIDQNGCTYDSLVTISDVIGEEKINIPNIFTPSQDKMNDTWYVTGECLIDISCQIFNRWGNPIAELKHITESWDGKTNGELVKEGVYFYLLQATFASGRIEDFHGHITVVYK